MSGRPARRRFSHNLETASENTDRSLRRLRTDRRYAGNFTVLVAVATVAIVVGAICVGLGHAVIGVVLVVLGLTTSVGGGWVLNRTRTN